MTSSLRKSLLSLKQSERAELESLIEELGYRWNLQARDKQKLPPGDWVTWLILAGRGWGKTFVGSQTVRIWSEQVPIIHLVGRTATDVRDTMVEGPAGILAVHPNRNKPKYEPSKRRITWPNGCRAILFTADEPDLLRGPQCYKAWADELASWKYAEEAWDMLMMGLRLGVHPQVLVTTTPRPIPTVKDLIKQDNTHITKGSTFENKDNLAKPFLDKILAKYEGTRLGRQELYAEILEDVEGALWSMSLVDKAIVKEAPSMDRIVVALDPATTNKETSDEFGIIVAGLGEDGFGYVLGDITGKYSPSEWARLALNAYYTNKADRVVAEANQGGDMIEHTLRVYDSNVSYKSVHASKGKTTRAEPIAALYEQHKIKHLGHFPELETEMTTWAANKGEPSPNRVDALVWAFTELMLTQDTFFVT